MQQCRWTALICAAINGHTECVRLLLEVRADKDAKERVRKACFRFEFCDSFEIIFFEHVSSPRFICMTLCNSATPDTIQHGWTPLTWAAHGGHTECARLLLGAGADKGAKDNVRAMWVVESECCLDCFLCS
jgi:ankyrin repeat protein